MGSLDKSNQISVDLESERATTSNGDESTVHPPLAHDESIQLGSDKRLTSFTSCSSSISSDSSHMLREFDGEHDKSSLKLEADDQLATELDEKPEEQPIDSGTPSSPSSPSADDYTSESPPMQVMERPEASKYRIPSHVFARKKSSTLGDWSMASNESLFSIPTGGASFCYQDSFLWRSGELGLGYGAETSISNPQYDNQFVGGERTEAGKSNELGGEDIIHELGEVNNQGSNMLDEPINSDNKEDQQSSAEEQASYLSAESSSSSKSFMFPILAGETEKGNSPNPHGSLMGAPEEPKLGPAPRSPPAPEPETSEAKAETKKATPLIAWTKWFPCACCS